MRPRPEGRAADGREKGIMTVRPLPLPLSGLFPYPVEDLVPLGTTIKGAETDKRDLLARQVNFVIVGS